MKSLKNLAEGNLKSAQALYTVFKQTSDESYLHDVCYLCQQAVEKMLKYLLEQQGIAYPRTHDIEVLCELCENNHIQIPETINDRALQISKWATEPRYGANFVASKRALDQVMASTIEWIGNHQVRGVEETTHNLYNKLSINQTKGE
ncbi:MAG: HEPN domain-containing protein [Cellulosilyticaceae bacterium]